MTSLANLQAGFQRHVLERDPSISAWIASPPTGSVEQRLAIYADAYLIRLREALASNFPRLQRFLGEAAFAAIADAYIEAQPSTFRSIRWFGDALPALLREALPNQPWLAELADWEWALAAAFDSADARPITAADLVGVPPDEWPGLCFVLHPSVRSLRMRTNAPELFSALAHGADVPSPRATSDTFWLISRAEITTRYRAMTEREARALNSLLEGHTFEAMCTTLCAVHAPHEAALHAAQLLRAWIEEGLVCNVARALERNDR